MRLIGNVEKDAQVRAVASGALPSGDAVVVNADGTVSVVAGAAEGVGSSSVFESAAITDPSATFDSSNNKVVIAYKDDGNSSYGTAVVGTVSGTSISFGAPVVFKSGGISSPDATFDSNSNKVVIAYRGDTQGRAIVGTVSGTSISFGSEVTYQSSNSTSFSSVFDSSNNKVVIAYRDITNNDGKAVVGTVSGTSITFGTPVQFESGIPDNVSAVFDSSNNKIIIACKDTSNSSYGTAVVGTVSGTAISFGTPVVFNAASTTECSAVFDNNSNKVVIAYTDSGNSDYGTAIVGTVSGTSISFGSPTVYYSAYTGGQSAVFDTSSNQVVVSFFYSRIVSGAVSGTSISFGSVFGPIQADRFDDLDATFDSNANKVVLSYQDEGNSNYGTALVFTVGSTNLTPENFLGFAAHTYADTQSALVNSTCTVDRNQTSLTAGQTYYVQTDGSLGTTAANPSVVAGTAISSTEIIVKG